MNEDEIIRTRLRFREALCAGMTIPGEMARVTGLPRSEAGLGNRALVAEGYATMPARGVYRLAAGVAD